MTTTKSAYETAGVNLQAGDQTINLISQAVKSTYNQHVLAGIGAFGGLFDISFTKTMTHPVLVSSTDGVGTKTKIAAQLNNYTGIGHDIVNHCINDILVQGARPLYFLDYVASAKLEPSIISSIVTGIASACKENNVALLGGETAEMPGVYTENEFDLVGTIIGILDKPDLIDGSNIKPGDKILGLESGGLQTNGFSLARHVLSEHYHDAFHDSTIGETLLHPHRSYVTPVTPLLDAKLIKGMAHITGGGITGNLPRILPENTGARIDTSNWTPPAIFTLIQEKGNIDTTEMFDVFNMGIGYVLIISPENLNKTINVCPEPLHVIGEITEGTGVTLT